MVVDLVDASGKEAVVGRVYRQLCHILDEPRVEYTAWDFHEHCKGGQVA